MVLKVQTNSYVPGIPILALVLAITATHVRADSASEQEYRIKAAFLYNFIKFVEWPKGKIRFEINNTAAKRAKLDIRSKLLRLAKRTIDDLSLLMDKECVVAESGS